MQGAISLTHVQPGPFAVGDPAAMPAQPILQIEDLQTHFFTAVGTVRAVDGVSYALHSGESVPIGGEQRVRHRRAHPAEAHDADGVGGHRPTLSGD